MGVLSRRSSSTGKNGRAVRRTVQRAGESALREFGCDVAFISDDSTPAETLVADEIARCQQSPPAQRLLTETFDRLRLVYDLGDVIRCPAQLQTIIARSAAASEFALSGEQADALLAFFGRINRTLFQHQALAWLCDTDFKIHLHGHGWEQHPQLARYARGAAESEEIGEAITRSSKITLHLAADAAESD